MAGENNIKSFENQTLPGLLRGFSSGKGTQYRSASGDVSLWKRNGKIGGSPWMEGRIASAVNRGRVNGSAVQGMLTRRKNERKAARAR